MLSIRGANVSAMKKPGIMDSMWVVSKEAAYASIPRHAPTGGNTSHETNIEISDAITDRVAMTADQNPIRYTNLFGEPFDMSLSPTHRHYIFCFSFYYLRKKLQSRYQPFKVYLLLRSTFFLLLYHEFVARVIHLGGAILLSSRALCIGCKTKELSAYMDRWNSITPRHFLFKRTCQTN